MIILLLIAALPPVNTAQVERVDLIEINHVCRFDGKHFHQVILWDWHTDGYHVLSWRSCCEDECVSRSGNGWLIPWRHGRFIEATHRRETWTVRDPEVEDRKRWPERFRRELFN